MKMDDVPKFFFYSAEGIQAAFNQLYVKPTNQFQQVTYQTMYNIVSKSIHERLSLNS
jgi:hypothetical protein